ncbi:hypothetical protein RFI_09789 [Reticulomyxa filosa]|uniref:Ubiquitin-like domain-containing protein n=1 Tax=Reticulomyxa filosa TaxID=46433 RepID=X6NMY0_RETFI|nr:hypothetical protein RFI_09789 [Reticulomyxa filosa]|eukprot:ETO27351.1 hypothetical protein RFI_09789 [Reticulomyxa filosa]
MIYILSVLKGNLNKIAPRSTIGSGQGAFQWSRHIKVQFYRANMSVDVDNKESATDLVQSENPHKYNVWKAKWQKKEYSVYWDEKTTAGDLKEQLEEQTQVPAEKQQLVGFKYAKNPKNDALNISDNTLICQLKCNKNKFIMIGTLQEHAFRVSVTRFLT